MVASSYFNRIQSGSFQHHCTAAALHIQHGPGWLADVAFSSRSVSDVLVKFSKDSTPPTLLENYKKRRLMSKSGSCNQDNSYGQTLAQPDISPDELQHLCKEYV